MSRAFPTGWGQSDTHAVLLSDGTLNPHPTAGTPYGTITGREIVALVQHPQPSVPKAGAAWFIPSGYAEFDARSHQAQREHGAFWCLCVDVDKGNPSLSDVVAALAAVVRGALTLVYSSRSATADCRKWRGLVPLARPLAGADYGDTQSAFFDLLEAGVCPDRALDRPGQLVYLPNAGLFYEHIIIQKGARLDLAPGHPIVQRREAARAARAEAERLAKQRRAERAAQRQSQLGAKPSPVEAFNAAHTIAALLAKYGYTPDPAGDADWRSPFQTGSTFATRDYGDFWLSLSGSDAAQGLGRETASRTRGGDAFDLFVRYEHGGDFGAALRAWAEQFPRRRA